MAWKDMLGAHHYASMLEKSFFPKWVQVLSTWLANNPNFDEITKWWVRRPLLQQLGGRGGPGGGAEVEGQDS